MLFSIYRYQGEAYLLLLECIHNHAYEKSRFLHGHATIDEDKIPVLTTSEDIKATSPLAYVNPNHPTIHLLDKILSFDEIQNQIYQLQPPLIIIGSAGSGKTALTLEKMKQSSGDILYVSRSPYLVHNSRNLYYALDYQNDAQSIDFLSFDDYLASIHVPPTKEMPFREFANWFIRHRSGPKLKDAHQLFEEFKGVITGHQTEVAYLSREAYLDLGIKQSIFAVEERPLVYDLFERYLEDMRDQGYHDSNIISHAYLEKVKPSYDFIIVDEVQDLTNIQLQVILKALNEPTHFILCGDSNQIVHPNFFSWSKVKSLFYHQKVKGGPPELIRVLNTNYRNSPQVTQAANNILKIKNTRFGSIDKESNYLVQTNVDTDGKIALLADDKRLLQQLDQKSRLSTHFAVIVMFPEQKAQAKQHFKTPLVFSVQEAKGLEYENIILYHFVSSDEARFQEICKNVTSEDLKIEALTYARVKDKSDKSLEIFKFYVNALYVAITRAICNLYWVETNPKHRLFNLLDLQAVTGDLDNLPQQESTLDEWRKEAHKLEMQGKQEQAEEIRHQILKQKVVPWEIFQGNTLAKLRHKAIEEGHKKSKLALFEYALVYNEMALLEQLAQVGFKPAKKSTKWFKAVKSEILCVL
ncbi:Ankyrin [Beggiatoa sp. PS]|nr:Ankyrin [Beggiatoa sp. PS]